MVQGAKTVVLGLGGSGLKVLQLMPSGANAELIALSTDEDAIWSLDDEIKRILIRDPAALCGDMRDARKLLPSVFEGLESALSGAEMAVIAGFAGKSDARIGGLVAELCAEKGVFTLIMQSGCPADAEAGAVVGAVLEGLKDKVDGVIIACRPGTGHAGAVAEAVGLLSASLSGSGYICANREELRSFFKGGVFRLAAGSGLDHGAAIQEALEASGNGVEGIKGGRGSALVLASGPSELGIPEMRDATRDISAATGADGIKWIGAQGESGNAGIALILPIESMPYLHGGAGSADETAKSDDCVGSFGEGVGSFGEGAAGPGHDAIGELIPSGEAEEMPAYRYTGLEPVGESLSVEDAMPAKAEMLPIGGLLADDENDAPSAAAVAAAELERIAAAELDIPEIGGDEDEPGAERAEEDAREVVESIAESLRFRSPALIGMNVNANRAVEREVAMKRAYEKGIITRAPKEGARPEKWRDDTDDAVSELSGYPSYTRAKPSQKKLGEYGFFKKFR